jgi:hypothetical protein
MLSAKAPGRVHARALPYRLSGTKVPQSGVARTLIPAYLNRQARTPAATHRQRHALAKATAGGDDNRCLCIARALDNTRTTGSIWRPATHYQRLI